MSSTSLFKKLVVASIACICLAWLPSSATAGECGGFTVMTQLNLSHNVSVFVLDGLGQTVTIAQGPGVNTYYLHSCKCENPGSGFGGCWYDKEMIEEGPDIGATDDGCEFRDGSFGYQFCRCTQPNSVCCD